MKKLKEKFNKLSVSRKVQLVAALAVTIAFLIAVPIIAWFNYQREIIKLQKIDSPNVLFLSAAHREDETNFLVDGINADALIVDYQGNKVLSNGNEQKITHMDYVFNVTGEAVDEFTIQLAYTTNNPFEYEIYAAEELDETEMSAEVASTAGQEYPYVVYTTTGERVTGMPNLVSDSNNNYHLNTTPPAKLYYKIDNSLTDNFAISGLYRGTYLNLDTANTNGTNQNALSTGNYHTKTYDQYSNVHIDAEPVYWQTLRVSAFPGSTNANKQAFSRHFILRVKWDAGSLDNTSKETDIVYITVKATK